MANNAQEVEIQIWKALAECIDADELRDMVFGKDELLDQYLQVTPSSTAAIKEVANLVFQRLQDLKFDEFKDKEAANWRRVRAFIEHENALINHRLSWLFSSQAFLFTAFTLVFNVWKSSSGGLGAGNHFPYLLSIISGVGILICLSIQRGLNAAEEQIRLLDKWWLRRWDNQLGQHVVWKNRSERNLALEKQSLKHPPLQGFIRRVWLDRWLTYSTVPTIFLLAWALIVVLIVFDFSSAVGNFLGKQGFLILSYIAVAIVALVIKEFIGRIRSNA